MNATISPQRLQRERARCFWDCGFRIKKYRHPKGATLTLISDWNPIQARSIEGITLRHVQRLVDEVSDRSVITFEAYITIPSKANT